MAKLTFETDLCKGCGLCVDACPAQILKIDREQINRKGHSQENKKEETKSTSCASCAMMCPDCVITVER